MMNRSGCSILLRRPLATTLVGIAALVALAATVVAAGFATDAGRRGDMGLPVPAEAVAAASLETAPTPGGAVLPSALSDPDRPDEASSGTDALADFGEGAAVRLLSDLGILALAGGARARRAGHRDTARHGRPRHAAGIRGRRRRWARRRDRACRRQPAYQPDGAARGALRRRARRRVSARRAARRRRGISDSAPRRAQPDMARARDRVAAWVARTATGRASRRRG